MANSIAGVSDGFDAAIADLLRMTPQPFFVQIGGYDGVSFDPLRRHIEAHGLSGVIVEPVPEYFDKLQALYCASPRVTTVRCAIAEDDGERTLWRFNPAAIERGLLPPHFAGIASFVMEDLLADGGVLGASSPDDETRAVLRSQLRPVHVPCRTMAGLLSDCDVSRVDLLQIDTEGYDYAILKLFDFERYRPAVVHYEHQHLSRADALAAETLLRAQGYRLRRGTYDTVALTGTDASARFQIGPLCALAQSLLAAGRTADALLLLKHLHDLAPDDDEILKTLARALGQSGETLGALETLFRLRAVTADIKGLADEIRIQMPAAIERFNAHLQSGALIEAERYIAALAGLLPGNPTILHSALHCAIALNRDEDMRAYAAAMLAVDRSHELARTILSDAVH